MKLKHEIKLKNEIKLKMKLITIIIIIINIKLIQSSLPRQFIVEFSVSGNINTNTYIQIFE